MSEWPSVFGPEGPLAAAVNGFQARPGQAQMAEAVATAVAERQVLLAEAGTGTGKTYAYLVPALSSGQKVIISTGTKTLQDQLFRRDLPLVRKALGLSLRLGLLKGRANYLCLHRFEQTVIDGRFDSREQVQRLQALRQWASQTRSGDLAEAPGGALDDGLALRVSSTTDNCLGQECPHIGDCFLMEARRRAQEADVLVVNHHLLLADWALKEGGFGEVLPAAEVFVLDEAHQLPEVAAQFFGLSLSSRQLLDFLRDGRRADVAEAGDVPALSAALDRLERAVLELRLSLGAPRRAAWLEQAQRPETLHAVARLQEVLAELDELLAALAVRGKLLQQCQHRSELLCESLRRFLEPPEGGGVQWFETYPQAFILRLTPLDVAAPFQARLQAQPASWILTSATLSVGGDFTAYKARLGLQQAQTLCLDSPFDYRRNALCYLPPLPAPAAPEYLQAYLETALELIEICGGRAFLLFTSHKALREAALWLRGRLAYPLLVQGEAGQAELLERFRALGDAVLLGTASFWEGVDVRGEALSCVIIDRLPFASPGDPVLKAKIAAMEQEGGNPFRDYQLPLAVIGLRQGVGRLIRDTDDRGVLMIGDNRVLTRSYGRVFLESLPPMRPTREIDDVRAFMRGEGAEDSRWEDADAAGH